MSDEQATEFFDGNEVHQKRGHTLDTQLRNQVNRSHKFPAKRPI